MEKIFLNKSNITDDSHPMIPKLMLKIIVKIKQSTFIFQVLHH